MDIKDLNITYIGNEVLRAESEKIDKIDSDIKNLSSKMIEMMYRNNGIGLAAPQVGLNLKLTVIDIKSMDASGLAITPGEALLIPQMPIVLINPEITAFSTESSVIEEGCLSVPGIYAGVERPVSVNLKAKLLSGESIDVFCGGFLARVLQHEIDHLNGILFVDKLKEEELRRISSKLKKLDKKLKKKKLI